ncbi:hypothetical protein PAXINDRAFT_14275 [Paxillus involutus ATCC 200175]|uniref:Uncharacterized protein n=1 Tax=Paxillus involutus ATCC 200175 TaxID=664439 RepID=A0A0C9TBD7_PAXIN|nr:hypothetical protein PAXINDRAFT_14275 [Paxillus involutus ATCC 200175]
MFDRETGRSKEFGSVSFEDTNVQPFLGSGNLEIDGELIDVKLDQQRYQQDHFREDGSPQQQYAGARSGPGVPGGGAAASGGCAHSGACGNLASGATGAGPMDGAPAGNTAGGVDGGTGDGKGGVTSGDPGMGGGMGMMQADGSSEPGSLGPDDPCERRARAPGALGGPQRTGLRGQHGYHPYGR